MIIKLYSTEKGIKLTDSAGKDLMRVLSREVKTRIREQKDHQFRHTYDELRRKIVEHDVISFDIFDTLITRRVPEPEMVFDLVGRFAEQHGIQIADFRRERVRAQLESGLYNANLDEVYDQLRIQLNLTKEEADLLKREELECEKRIILPRREMVELFQFALEAQKKVYLVTDMYLNRRYIVSLLNACGITGYYDILVSCEYRKLKLEGLFDELIKIQPGRSILHIGDNYIHDCICAEVAGVDSLLIPKGIDLGGKNGRLHPGIFSRTSDKMMLGSIISYAYNSPFTEKKGRKWYDIGYSFLGPIVLSLTEWMVDRASIGEYDGILLSARDGYLLDKVFALLKEKKLIEENLEIHYFYVSRKAAVSMHTDEESIVNMLIDRTGVFYLPDKMLQEVFCLPEDLIEPYDFGKYGDKRYQYVWDNMPEIRQNVHNLKRNFYRYLGKERIKTGGRYLFYDFVSSGTVQRAISNIVPFEIDGLYYQFTGEKDFFGKVFSKFPDKIDWLDQSYKILELLMLSPEPSLWNYDENGKAIFCTEQRSEEFLKVTEEVHRGALSFAGDYLRSFRLTDASISDELTEFLVQEMGKQFCATEHESELIDDWFMGGEERK